MGEKHNRPPVGDRTAATQKVKLVRCPKPTIDSPNRQPQLVELSIAQVHRNPKQPRQNFDKSSLNELAQSIKADGLLIPILVRPNADGYEIVHGERRWRASQIAGLSNILAEVRDISPDEAHTLSIIENEQREGLSPIETAQALKAMMDAQNLTPSGVAKRIGKGRDWVASKVRLLNLPDEAQALVRDNLLSEGHAKQLLKLNTASMCDKVASLAQQAASGGWSVARLQNEVDATITSVSHDTPPTLQEPCPHCGGTGFVLGKTETSSSVSRDTIGAE